MSRLIYKDGVRKTPAITRTVDLLESYFEDFSAEVTSGLRTHQEQINIISEKMKRHGIYKDFPEFDLHLGSSVDFSVDVDDQIIYFWQRGWSKCLNIGDIVNPPLPAKCLYDYFRPGDTENKKGQVIEISPHQRGLAFDISGGSNLTEVCKRVMHAYQKGDCFILNYLQERINNACHVGVKQIG